MAQEVQLPGRELEVKIRRPAAVAALSVVTLGIYALVWYYKVNREMRDFGRSHGDRELAESRPWRSVFALLIGDLILIPKLVSFVRTIRRVQAVERIATGTARPGTGVTALLVVSAVLPFVQYVRGAGALSALAGVGAFLGVIWRIQARLNDAWESSPPPPLKSQVETDTLVLAGPPPTIL